MAKTILIGGWWRVGYVRNGYWRFFMYKQSRRDEEIELKRAINFLGHGKSASNKNYYILWSG